VRRPTLRSPRTDVTIVAPNLFIGSRPPPGRYRWLGVLALCAQEYQPPSYAFPGVAVLHVPLDDDPRRAMYDVEVALAMSNARTVARYLQSGQRVLVTCAMGLNRSALVAGLAMQRAFGMRADDVIEQIRDARSPSALGNKNFVRLLRSCDVDASAS
jgi:protein-tyrosine phosphatase